MTPTELVRKLIDNGMAVAAALDVAAEFEADLLADLRKLAAPARAEPAPVVKSKAAQRMERYRANRVANGMSPGFDGRLFHDRLKARDGDLCVYCVESPGDTVDHMVPVSSGGTDEIDNLALSCGACNCGKAGRMPGDGGGYLIRVASAEAAHVRYVRERAANIKAENTPANRSEPVREKREQNPSLACVRDITLNLDTSGKITSEPIGSSGRGREADVTLLKPNGFARFWEEYPSKVGKRAAETAYDRALRRIDGPDPPAVILDGVRRAKAGRRWRDGYVPNPATWLNQDRWTDETEQTHERPGPPDRKQAAFRERLSDIDAAMEAAVVPASGGR